MLFSMRLEMISPHPPLECATRLAAASDRGWRKFWFLGTRFGESRPVGKVSKTRIRLRKQIPYNNPWQTWLIATMRPLDHGTLIRGRLGVHQLFYVYSGLLLGLLGLFGSVIFTVIAEQPHDRNVWMGMGMLVLLLISHCGIFALGRYLARGEDRFLRQFLIETLDAQDAKCDM
jgi:hypothetical protein